MATPTVTNPADTVSALLAGTYGDAARAIAQQEVSAAWSRGNIAAASILAEISRRLIAHIVDEFAARGVTVPQDVIEHAEDVLTTLRSRT